MNVLVIEDDPAGRAGLRKILERAGFIVTSVDNGLAAFAEIQQQDYKAIVCDILLPYMDGVEFYRQLQSDYPELASRVLFVTAWAHEPPIRRFLESTKQPYLAKPYDIDELAGVVRELVDESN